MKDDLVLIIDFGSQVTQLIARRLRELKVYCEIHPFNKTNDEFIKTIAPKAIILSGGPASVLDDDAPVPPSTIFDIDVPVLGIIENMAYFTPEELPDNKYYIFGKQGAQNLAEDKNVPFLGSLPLVQSVREAADLGRPAALQEGTAVQQSITEVTQNLVTQLLKRNTTLPPTKAVSITNMVGCEAIK